MAISMLKIRRPLGRLIFNMGIAIPGKTVFLIETAPRKLQKQCWFMVNWAHRNKLKWNSNQNRILFIQENVFENVVYKCQPFYSGLNMSSAPGSCLNIKTVFPRYGDSHVKDKTVGENVLSLTWESLYWYESIFILRRPPGSFLKIKTSLFWE